MRAAILTADVLKVIQHRGVLGHLYADDISIYLYTEASQCTVQIRRIAACIDDINNWTSSNRLKQSTDKTLFIRLDTTAQRTIILADANIQVSDVVTCFRVVIDSQLTFADSFLVTVSTTFDSLACIRWPVAMTLYGWQRIVYLANLLYYTSR